MATAVVTQSVSSAISAGIAKVEASTPADVKKYLDGVVLRVAKRNTSFTTDAIHEAISNDVKRPKTISGSAIGPAILRAQRAGYVQASGDVIKSTRPSRHGNRLPVWMSNLFGITDSD